MRWGREILAFTHEGARMSVLDRVPVEARRQTGWLVPVVISSVVGWFLPDAEHVLGQSERLWTSGTILTGLVAGVLWQWYSPRELSERLVVPTAGVLAFALLLVIPVGEFVDQGAGLRVWFPIGVVAGLVVVARRQSGRGEREQVRAEQSLDT